ncbi:cystatin-like [Rhinophrynus dorsalis]
MAARFCLCFSALSLLIAFVSGNVLVGAPENIDPNDPGVQKAVSVAMKEYNVKSNEETLYKVIKVVSAKAQVVAGVKYFIDVEIGKTNCNKHQTNDKMHCGLIKNTKQAKTYLCSFQVMVVPWLNQETLSSYSCKEQ